MVIQNKKLGMVLCSMEDDLDMEIIIEKLGSHPEKENIKYGYCNIIITIAFPNPYI